MRVENFLRGNAQNGLIIRRYRLNKGFGKPLISATMTTALIRGSVYGLGPCEEVKNGLTN